MRLRRLATGILLTLALLTWGSRPGWSIEPITDALLDKAESSAKDVIARAEAAGNAVARAVGEQALKVVEALRVAVHSSIGDAKQAYLESQQQTFDNLNLVLERVQHIETVSMGDMTTLLANLSDQVGNLPFINQPPAVMLYQPRVIVPEDPSPVPVHAIGPKLARSEPVITFKGATVPVQRPREVELIAILKHESLNFDRDQPRYVPLTRTYLKIAGGSRSAIKAA